MKKRLLTAALAAVMTVAMGITSLAGEWHENKTGWWWTDDDGSNPALTWRWLDGNKDGVSECYYFDSNGYMVANATTPDGYTVNADGAWVVDGSVQLKYNQTSSSSSTATSSSSNDFAYADAYERIGTYTAENGAYFELGIGMDDGFAGFLYDEDGDLDGVYSFAKVNNTTYKDSSKARTLTFVDDNTITVGTKTYYR